MVSEIPLRTGGRTRAKLAGVSLLALATGCSTLPEAKPAPGSLPAAFYNLPQQSAGSMPVDAHTAASDMSAWWRGFNDPLLDRLVSEAVAANIPLRQAVLRVKEARALSHQTVAAYAPIVALGARGEYTEVIEGPPLVGSFQSFITGGGQRQIVQEDRQMYAAGGPQVAWEIPLFPRLEAAAEGARSTARAAMEEVRAAQVALTGDIAQAYVNLRLAQNRRQILRDAAAASLELAAIVDQSAAAGIAAPADAADARRLAENVRARIPDAQLEVSTYTGQIALLRGLAPGADPITATLVAPQGALVRMPTLRVAAMPAAPADLLRLRPDIMQAEARVGVAAADLGVARVDLLPQLRLTGGINVADNVLGSALPERAVQLGLTPQVSIPLIGWGQRLAAVRARDSRFDQALLQYQEVVNRGVAEAQGNLTALAQADVRLQAARAAEDAAVRQNEGARALWSSGISSLADRLRSDQQLLDARLARIEAEAIQARAAIGVYRAFGGGAPDLGAVQAAEREIPPRG